MQNDKIEKAISWNPWHGCRKASAGCKNCFVYKMDKRYGRDTNVVAKCKTTYLPKDKDVPAGSLVKLCFSSDFFSKRRMSGVGSVGILYAGGGIVYLC